MARLNSFYLPPDAWPSTETALLRGKEAHHLGRVLRHKPGDNVRLFDGQGRWGLFEIIAISKKVVELELVEHHEEPAVFSALTLALGWNKSSRREWLLEKCVELQGAALLFWQASRSQGKVPDQPKDKWQERTIQAAKQCGTARLPELRTCSEIGELIAFSASFENKIVLWEAGKNIELLAPTMLSKGKTLAVIGPEGGLAQQEVELFLEAGFQLVTLGNSILRWETAALHCLSLAFFSRQLHDLT